MEHSMILLLLLLLKYINKLQMAQTLNPVILYVVMVALVLAGTGNGIVIKLENNVTVDNKKFEHAFFQTLIMFLGESLWILVFIYEVYSLRKNYGSVQASPGMQKAIQDGLKTNINPLWLTIPMWWDSCASALLLIAYINIPASIAQMMGGLVVFVVAIMSVLFLKRKLYRHHWTGLCIIFTGICLVALAALLDKGSDAEGNTTLGIWMMVASILVQGWQYVIEEKLLGSYYLSPMLVVGVEGISGTLLFCVLLTIFQFIPCTSDICSNGKVEDSIGALQMLGESAPLVIFVIFNILFVGLMNGLGMVVTKYASAANRVTLQQTKNVLVWIFFLIYQGGGHESFKWLQLVGFVILVCGVILYNEIIEVPIFGFSQNTKAAIQRRKLNLEGSDANNLEAKIVNDATDYAQSSPHAYDKQRQYNKIKNNMETKTSDKNKNNDLTAEGLD